MEDSTQQATGAQQATPDPKTMDVEELCTSIMTSQEFREQHWERSLRKLLRALVTATESASTAASDADKAVLKALKVLVDSIPQANSEFVRLKGLPIILAAATMSGAREAVDELGSALSPDESVKQAIVGEGPALSKAILRAHTNCYLHIDRGMPMGRCPLVSPQETAEMLRDAQCHMQVLRFLSGRTPMRNFMCWPAMAALFSVLPAWLDSHDRACLEGALMIAAMTADTEEGRTTLVDAGIVEKLAKFFTPGGRASHSVSICSGAALTLLTACPRARCQLVSAGVIASTVKLLHHLEQFQDIFPSWHVDPETGRAENTRRRNPPDQNALAGDLLVAASRHADMLEPLLEAGLPKLMAYLITKMSMLKFLAKVLRNLEEHASKGVPAAALFAEKLLSQGFLKSVSMMRAATNDPLQEFCPELLVPVILAVSDQAPAGPRLDAALRTLLQPPANLSLTVDGALALLDWFLSFPHTHEPYRDPADFIHKCSVKGPFGQEVDPLLALVVAECPSEESYAVYKEQGFLRDLVNLLQGPLGARNATGLWPLARLAGRVCSAPPRGETSLPSETAPSFPQLVPDLLELNFVEPFLLLLQQRLHWFGGADLRGIMQLLLLVCADEEGARQVAAASGGYSLLVSLASSRDPTQRRAGVKALSTFAAKPEEREALRAVKATEILARQFRDLSFMEEQEWPDLVPQVPLQPSGLWAARGLLHMALVIDDRSFTRHPPSLVVDQERKLLDETFAAVLDSGAMSSVLAAAKVVEGSEAATSVQPYAARVCGILAYAYRKASVPQFLGRGALQDAVRAFGACKDPDTGLGLLNMLEGLLIAEREKVALHLIRDGIMAHLLEFVHRSDVEPPHLVAACELFLSIVGDRDALRVADKCGMEEAFRELTTRDDEVAPAASMCVTLLEYLRDPWGWWMKGTPRQLSNGTRLFVEGAQPTKRVMRLHWDGSPSHEIDTFSICVPGSDQFFYQIIEENGSLGELTSTGGAWNGCERVGKKIVSRMDSPELSPRAAALPVRYKVCCACGSPGGSEPASKLKKCSRCRSVLYCGAECQKRNWPTHQAACRHLAG
eukprot:jgi/Botrbrau1/9660/Bobra.0131s0032.1